MLEEQRYAFLATHDLLWKQQHALLKQQHFAGEAKKRFYGIHDGQKYVALGKTIKYFAASMSTFLYGMQRLFFVRRC